MLSLMSKENQIDVTFSFSDISYVILDKISNIKYFDIEYAADKNIKYLFEYGIFAKIFIIEC